MRKLVLLAVLLAAPIHASAQIEVEARGGIAIGSHSTTLAGLDIAPRPATDLLVKLNRGRYSILAAGSVGWFGCTEGFCDGPSTVNVRHVSGALGAEARLGPVWLRSGGGMAQTQLRTESAFGPTVFASAGWRAAVSGFLLTPGATYRWTRDGDSETVALSAELGISYRIGGA